MPAGFGGVDGGNQWDVEVFGESDSWVCDQPIVGVHDIGDPRPIPAALDSQTGSDH